MDDPTRVKRAFERALPDATAPSDPQADLARARDAVRARTRRRVKTGLGALAVVLVAGVGVAGALDRATPDQTAGQDPAGHSTANTATDRDTPITLLATRFHARPYSFGLTPKGWSVQARTPYLVTIVPDGGSTSPDPDVFIGKLVITFDHNRLGGRRVRGGHRWVAYHVDAGYTTMSMRTTSGEPAGVVRIQYPDDAGWDHSTMERFLLSIHVGPGARPSLG
ncbi:MAG TPA: hypothetical protein VHW64_02055 [Nocardioides sp.]|jgi:hypothetical protein|uniref:hypothetical protein n=1 Tax=Nocardioides sp. TaxID=35761 RepID=UPI002E36B5AC|nr:hypothetical protein [Nocardioides sp.]HEX3929459.1 hypothetical protein [Nocardioides sp.]